MSARGAAAGVGAARRGSPALMARALWGYRGFIAGMVARDFRSRYLRSAFGALWSVASPAVMLAVYLLVFSEIMRARIPGSDDPMAYGLFLVSGLLPWLFFQEVVTRCQTVFVEQGNLIKKAAFPRSSLPLSALLSAAVTLALSTGILLLFVAASGRWPGAALAAWVPLALLLAALGLGLGVLLGTVHVFFRDAGHAVGLGLQLWFWLTPIVYPAAILPQRLRWLLKLNPLTPVAEGYQGALLEGRWPQWASLWPAAAAAAVALALSLVAFRRLAPSMVDEL